MTLHRAGSGAPVAPVARRAAETVREGIRKRARRSIGCVMNDLERKIEKRLDDYFRSEGWEIVSNGDHIAVKNIVVFDDDGNDAGADEAEVNTTQLAKEIAQAVR